MHTFEDRVNSNILLFISQLRSENTKEGAKEIIQILLDSRNREWPGWVRSSEIFNALDLNPSTTTRLLTAMDEAGVIIKRACDKVPGQRGSPRVFYRLPEYYDPNLFKSREELIQVIDQYNIWLSEALERCNIYREILAERARGLGDPEKLIKERLPLYRARKEKLLKEIKGSGLEIPDPCEQPL